MVTMRKGWGANVHQLLFLRWKRAWSTSCDLDQCWNQMKLTFLVKDGYWRHTCWKWVSVLLMMRHTRQLLRTVLPHTQTKTA